MPRFSVSANSKGFESIANIITNLLLQSDSVHKLRLSKIETLLFSYDFSDFYAAAEVVQDLQTRLRRALDQKYLLQNQIDEVDEEGQLEVLRMEAHNFVLSEELNTIFDAIQLAQQKQDDKYDDTKLALKVHASSREISWGMVDGTNEMIAKLALRGIDFTWLNRQDGSIVNNLLLKDLQVCHIAHLVRSTIDAVLRSLTARLTLNGRKFWVSDSAGAWRKLVPTEYIIAKYREPASHPLVKVCVKQLMITSSRFLDARVLARNICACRLDCPCTRRRDCYLRALHCRPTSDTAAIGR